MPCDCSPEKVPDLVHIAGRPVGRKTLSRPVSRVKQSHRLLSHSLSHEGVGETHVWRHSCEKSQNLISKSVYCAALILTLRGLWGRNSLDLSSHLADLAR